MRELMPREQVVWELCRTVASGFLAALAKTDLTLEDLDERLGKKKGSAQKMLLRLVNVEPGVSLRDIGELAYAIGAHIEISLRSRTEPFHWVEPKDGVAEPPHEPSDEPFEAPSVETAGSSNPETYDGDTE